MGFFGDMKTQIFSSVFGKEQEKFTLRTSSFQSLRQGCIFWHIPQGEEVCPKILGFMGMESNLLI